MFPYIFVLIPILLCNLLPRLSDRKIAIFLSLLVIVLFCGTRIGTGNDYYSYMEIYESVDGAGDSETIEILFSKLISIFKILGLQFELFLLIFTFLIVASIKYGMYFYFRYSSLPIIIFILNDMPILLMSVIRQGLAIGIILIGSNLLLERKFLKSAPFFVAATLFHSASIYIVAIVLISYIINKWRINRLFFISTIVCISILIAISNKFDFFRFISAKYDVYSSNYTEQNSAFIFGGYFLFKLIIFLYYFYKYYSINIGNKFNFQYYMLSASILLNVFLYQYGEINLRTSYFFDASLVIVCTYILLNQDKIHKYIIGGILFLYFSIHYFKMIYLMSDNFIPYVGYIF